MIVLKILKIKSLHQVKKHLMSEIKGKQNNNLTNDNKQMRR